MKWYPARPGDEIIIQEYTVSVDHETGTKVVLEGLSNMHTSCRNFTLYFEGAEIPFSGKDRETLISEPRTPDVWDIHWTFNEVRIPQPLKHRKEEIIDLIRQALQVLSPRWPGSGRNITVEYGELPRYESPWS